MHQTPYNPSEIEVRVQARWDDKQDLRGDGRPGPGKVLLPVHVAVPVRCPAHGACPQLHHW